MPKLKVIISILLCGLLWFPLSSSGTVVPTDYKKYVKEWFQDKGIEISFEAMADIALNHSDSAFRDHALQALREFFPDKSSEVILKMAKTEPDTLFRLNAALALGYMKDKRAIPLLKDTIKKLKEEMGDTLIIQFEIAVGHNLLNLGDLWGFKPVLEGRTSESENGRYFSVEHMSHFLKHREKILERYGVDPYPEYFKFANDPSTLVRERFIYSWPLTGMPDDMTKRFRTILLGMVKNDPEPDIKSLAQSYLDFYLKPENAPVQKN